MRLETVVNRLVRKGKKGIDPRQLSFTSAMGSAKAGRVRLMRNLKIWKYGVKIANKTPKLVAPVFLLGAVAGSAAASRGVDKIFGRKSNSTVGKGTAAAVGLGTFSAASFAFLNTSGVPWKKAAYQSASLVPTVIKRFAK